MQNVYEVCFKYIWDGIDCHIFTDFITYELLLDYYIQHRNVFEPGLTEMNIHSSLLPTIVQVNYDIVGMDEHITLILQPASILQNEENVTKEVIDTLNKDYEKWFRCNTIDNILKELGK